MNRLSGIAFAWIGMAFVSIVVAVWMGLDTWSQEKDLIADIQALKDLQTSMSNTPVAPPFEVLNLAIVRQDWTAAITGLDSPQATLRSVEVRASEPLGASRLVEHELEIRIDSIALKELHQLLLAIPEAAGTAEISLITPDSPGQTGPECWDVMLVLTPIHLGS